MVVRILCFGFVFSLLVSCADRTFTYNDAWRFRSTEEQQETERRALAGDNDAAKHLGFFYHLAQHDDVTALRWWQIAANRGDQVAKELVQTLRVQQRKPSNQAMQPTASPRTASLSDD